MTTVIAFHEDARESIRQGVATLSKAVRRTLGPRGRNVLLQRTYGPPLVTRDGVTVAKEIDVANPLENIGAKMVREVASKTNDVAGDGTTTATVLAESIFVEGLRAVTAGVPPLPLKQGIERATRDIVEKLRAMAEPLGGSAELNQVAALAANGDAEIGAIVADAIGKVGKHGVVAVEEGRSLGSTLELVEGMRFEKGYISPYFVTDASRMECVLEDCCVLVYEKKITSVSNFVPLLEQAAKESRPLLVIAEGVEGEALALLVVNKLQGKLMCCAVKAPGFGDSRKAMLEDIALLTGARPIMESVGTKLENVTLADLGKAKKVVVDKDGTTIIEGAGGIESIKARCEQLRRQIQDAKTRYDREQLEERLARLTGGVAKIQVGAATDSELKEKKLRYDDAIHAARAAMEEGVLPGGGVALVRAAAACSPDGLDEDERMGYRVVLKACRSPLYWIAENAGVDGGIVVGKVLDGSGAFGYNAATDAYEDLISAGVIDPMKVTRVALENASSVATLMLTSEALVAVEPEEPWERRSDFDYDE